ncbi:MAG: hypothetical protein AAFR56_19160 [Chloroflexota bacterium]
MKSTEAIRIAIREQMNGIIAVIIIMVAAWLLRRQIARLLLWLVRRNLNESKQYQ